MADRGRRVNEAAERLETLPIRSTVLELLYANLWLTWRLGFGVLEQLVDGQPELTETAQNAISGNTPLQKVKTRKCRKS